MSKLLVAPKETIALDRMRIAAFKVEDNVTQGRRWVEVWVVLGRRQIADDDTSFQQFVDPETGDEVYQYIKLENAMHPLSSGTALGKCSVCGNWMTAIGMDCDVEGCSGVSQAYDGAHRLILMQETNTTLSYTAFKQLLYSFLMDEMVPHPETWELVRLLDAQEG